MGEKQEMADTAAAAAPKPLSILNWVNLIAYVLNCTLTYLSIDGIFGATNTVQSAKYQTLVTPAGWAFSIWGPIFIWEGIFAVAQMLPCCGLRSSNVIDAISYWWVASCASQIAWSIAFAQDSIITALVFMLLILVCLIAILYRTYALDISYLDFWLLRGPFCLQLGWIIAAAVVNINVVAVWANAAADALLCLTVLSLCMLSVAAYLCTTLAKPEAIIVGVISWALGGVAAELAAPEFTSITDTFSSDSISALQYATAFLSITAAIVTAVLAGLYVYQWTIYRKVATGTMEVEYDDQKVAIQNETFNGGATVAV